MGEAGNQDDMGMAMVADVLTNRMLSANPLQYGTPSQGPASSYQGQLFARSGDGVPQFSLADAAQTRREGSGAANVALFNSIFQPQLLTGRDREAYDRAARIAPRRRGGGSVCNQRGRGSWPFTGGTNGANTPHLRCAAQTRALLHGGLPPEPRQSEAGGVFSLDAHAASQTNRSTVW
jgi:hypothetical protein